jgi:hypothetical protein
MRQTSSIIGLVILSVIGSFLAGWHARGAFAERGPSAVNSARGSEAAAPAKSTSQPRTGDLDACHAEREALRGELEAARHAVGAAPRCQAAMAESTVVSDDAFAMFRDNIFEAAEAIGHEGEVHFDCQEFPCIAMFDADFDTEPLKRSLEQLYGGGVDVMTRRHTSVGPGGSKKLRFAAVVPRDQADERTSKRFEERVWSLIEAHLVPREPSER